MRSLEIEIVQEIAAFENRGAFSNWLWETLRSVYALPSTKRGEDFRDFLIDTNKESPVDGLAAIYEQLETEEKKLLFRQSIGDVLISHGNKEDSPPEALEDLIYLMASSKAVESLNALLPTVGNGLLGKKHPECLYSTFAVLKLFSPSPQVQETMLHLVNSSNFDDGYLFEAIGILAECDPSNISGLLLHFQSRLDGIRRETQKLGGDEWDALCESANDLIEKIQHLDATVKPDTIRQIFFG